MDTNYTLIASRPKAKKDHKYERIPEAKDILLNIIKKDFEYWDSKKLKQPGIERCLYIRKMSEKIKVSAQIFDIAIEELEMEQQVIKLYDGHFERYIKGFF